MGESKLNKQLWTNINKLKLLKKATTQPKFILDKSLIDEIDEEAEKASGAAASKDLVILGRILPDSEIYREGAYQIEIKLTAAFPCDPPQVYFITKIYHPNVGKDGRFCNELLGHGGWSCHYSLVSVVRSVVGHIDKPDINHSLSLALGREYMENKSEFDRKAMEYVKKYALPRF